MNKKNCILVLAVLIILVILIDLIFNFSNILYENFQSESTELPKSIISKKDGRIINISFLKNDPNINDNTKERIIFLQSPLSNNKNISLNNDGTLSETFVKTMDSTQQWKLIFINNNIKYNTYLGNSTNGLKTDNTCVKYPFYIIVSRGKSNTWALQYDYGSLSCRPIGNYDSQKWDISSEPLKGKSIIIHNTLKNNSVNFRDNPDNNGEEVDPNKINLNFNIKNDILKQLLGNDNISNGDSGSRESNSCGTHIPNSAIESLCPGCSPELFE